MLNLKYSIVFCKCFQQNGNRHWNEVLYMKEDSAILALLSQIWTKKITYFPSKNKLKKFY